jgi:hypothetical protein
VRRRCPAAIWLGARAAVALALASAVTYVLHAGAGWAGEPMENANQLATFIRHIVGPEGFMPVGAARSFRGSERRTKSGQRGERHAVSDVRAGVCAASVGGRRAGLVRRGPARGLLMSRSAGFLTSPISPTGPRAPAAGRRAAAAPPRPSDAGTGPCARARRCALRVTGCARGLTDPLESAGMERDDPDAEHIQAFIG